MGEYFFFLVVYQVGLSKRGRTHATPGALGHETTMGAKIDRAPSTTVVLR